MTFLRTRVPLILATAAIFVVGGWYSSASPPADAIRLVDTGGQYGWSNPWSTPNDQSVFVKTQGRCGNGNSGQMVFRTGGGRVIAGPMTVPAEWTFGQGYGFTVPAGLAPGDYEFHIDCGGMFQIFVAQQVTGGGVSQFLEFVAGVVNPTPPPVTPQSNVDPVPGPSGGYGDSPVFVEEGSGGSAPRPVSAPKVTRTRLPQSSAKVTATTSPPAPVMETPTTVAAPVEVETVLPTEITRDKPERIALQVASQGSGFPVAPVAGGTAAAALCAAAVAFLRHRAAAPLR